MISSDTLVKTALKYQKISSGLAAILFELAKQNPTGGLKK